MNGNRSWKVSLIGLIILAVMVIWLSAPRVVANAFSPGTTSGLNADCEIFEVHKVINQVKAFDKDAETKVITRGEETVLEVCWRNNTNTPYIMELISVGEEQFFCRGEDVRELMAGVLNNR